MDIATSTRPLLLALASGLLAAVVFWGSAPGLNWPIWIAAVLIAGFACRPARLPFDPLDGWLPAGAFIFAVWLAIRSDPPLVAVNGILALLLLTGSMFALSGIPVTRASVAAIGDLLAWSVIALMTAAGRLARNLPVARGRTIHLVPGPTLGSLLRGLALSVPFAFVLVILFASADAVFGRVVDDLLSIRIDLFELPERTLFALVVAWLTAGLLSIVILGRTMIPMASAESAGDLSAGDLSARRGSKGYLGALEGTVVLLVADSLFGAFVGLQIAYLFGGLDTLRAAGLTYSEYARRGFFELILAAVVAGLLIAWLDHALKRRSRAYRLSALLLLALVGIVLFSSAYRLHHYQAAYGWTESRFFAYVAIVWLGVAVAIMTGLLATSRMDRLGHGLAFAGIGLMLACDVLGPQAFVARQNLERAANPALVPPDGKTGLDAGYLATLGDDAIPALVAALPTLAEPDRTRVAAHLEKRRSALALNPTLQGWAAWNLAREQARAALATLNYP